MSAKDDHTLLQELAERLGLDEGERENFVGSSMRRLGHKMSTLWEDADGGSDSGSGDFYSSRRQQRQVGNGNQNRNRGSDWQYGTGS